MRMPVCVVRICAVASFSLLLPAASQAGKISVDFDFTGSSVTILGGFVSVPPDGTISAGSGQLQVNGVGSATPGAGPAGLKNLALAGTLNKNAFGVAITGAVGATQPGTAVGALSGLQGNLAFNPFLMNFTGFANCANTGGGSGCTVLGLPATFTGPKFFSIPSLAVSNLASVGNAALAGTFSFTLGGFTAVLSLVGNEVARTFVPEPQSFSLLALGLAGLAAARRRLRR